MKFVFELMIRKLEILLENYVGIRFPPIKSFNFLQFLEKFKVLDIYLILCDWWKFKVLDIYLILCDWWKLKENWIFK